MSNGAYSKRGSLFQIANRGFHIVRAVTGCGSSLRFYVVTKYYLPYVDLFSIDEFIVVSRTVKQSDKFLPFLL